MVNSVIKLNQAIQTLRKILNTNKQARCEIKRAIKSNIYPYYVKETTDKEDLNDNIIKYLVSNYYDAELIESMET